MQEENAEKASTKIKLSAAIVTYNNAQLITHTVDTILQFSKDVELTLFLSDNHSTDDTVKIVREKFPQVVVLENTSNGGFGHGHNRVLSQLDSKYHVIINPDISLTEDTLYALASYMEENPNVVITTPMILNRDGTRQYLPQKAPKLRYLLGGRLEKLHPLFAGLRKEYTMHDAPLTKPREIDFCTGCFMMIRTEVFLQLGGFDERFFMYMEDADLTRRAKSLGRVVFCPQTSVVHDWHRASKKSLKFLLVHLKSVGQYMIKWRGKND